MLQSATSPPKRNSRAQGPEGGLRGDAEIAGQPAAGEALEEEEEEDDEEQTWKSIL